MFQVHPNRALKTVLAAALAVASAASSAYTPSPGKWGEVERVMRPMPCEVAPHFPGCETPRPRWDDCLVMVRYEPGFWPHVPCQFPKPWGGIR